MSPSAGPITPVLLYVMLMPLIGMPMLSRQRLDLVRRNDLADRLLDVGELVGGFLDPCADLGAHVHQDAAGIDGWKEVAAEIGHQQERHADKA